MIRLQEKIFLEKVRACEVLVLEGLPASEMQALARALPTYKKLKHLTIKAYTCGEQAARSLSEALVQIDVETLAFVDGRDKEGASAMVKAIAAVLKRDLSIKASTCLEIFWVMKVRRLRQLRYKSTGLSTVYACRWAI